jgi:hypothetical protein
MPSPRTKLDPTLPTTADARGRASHARGGSKGIVLTPGLSATRKLFRNGLRGDQLRKNRRDLHPFVGFPDAERVPNFTRTQASQSQDSTPAGAAVPRFLLRSM